MKYPTAEQIESADREQLAYWYRRLPAAQHEWQLQLTNRIHERFTEMGGFTPELSKKVGWS